MPGSENTFVGISNFAKMFKDISTKGSDAYFFWIAFRNNILAVLVTVPGQLVLALIVALMLKVENKKKGYGLEEINPIGRLALHAFKLCFRHPVTGELMQFETPYPGEFKKLFLKK